MRMPQSPSTPHLHAHCCRADLMAPLSTCIGLAGCVALQNGGYGPGISVSGQQATYTGSIVAMVQSFDSKVAEVPLDCKTQQVRMP